MQPQPEPEPLKVFDPLMVAAIGAIVILVIYDGLRIAGTLQPVKFVIVFSAQDA